MMAGALPPGPTPLLSPYTSLKVSARIAGKIILLKLVAHLRSNVTSAGTISMSTPIAPSAAQRLTIRRTGAQITVWGLLITRLSCSMVATSLRRG